MTSAWLKLRFKQQLGGGGKIKWPLFTDFADFR